MLHSSPDLARPSPTESCLILLLLPQDLPLTLSTCCPTAPSNGGCIATNVMITELINLAS